MMSSIAEGLFVLAFWAPPLAVVVGALALLAGSPVPRRSAAPSHTAALTH